MPEPLVSEDSDLQRLLETVHSQPGAEILYQDQIRRGGLFGFFTREVHRVAYRLPSDEMPEAEGATDSIAAGGVLADSIETSGVETSGVEISGVAPTGTDSAAAELPELGDLLATVEAIESAGQQPVPAAPPPAQDFAELLRRLTDGEPLEDQPPESQPGDSLDAGTGGVAEGPVVAISADRPISERPVSGSNVTTLGRPDARARLDMLMQLRQVGVPVSVNPRAETHSLYEALESILEELPQPVTPPRAAGQVLAIVGESGPALQAAHTCAAMLRIPRNTIRVAGLPEHSDEESEYPWISGRQEASRLRTELSRTDLPCIVVIATDATEAGSEDPWAAEMLAALRPTAVWAVVDARWKTEDSRAQLDLLGQVDALVVHSAALSASPASVWDLDLPLGLLDGRAASTFAWTGLLFRLLRGDARHRASA
jgi:hypothetical protein